MWSYVKGQRDGDKLYIGDHVGQDATAVTVRGKVGDEGMVGAEVSPEEAELLARNAGLRLLSTLSHYLDGDLDRVDQVPTCLSHVVTLATTAFHPATTHPPSATTHAPRPTPHAHQVIKVVGIVNGTPDFRGHGKVINLHGALPRQTACTTFYVHKAST